MHGFDILCKVAKTSLSNEEVVKELENGRRYLQTRFQMNCMNDFSVKSHDINFALSDPKNMKLSTMTDHDSLNEVCTDCLELWKAINTVRDIGE